MNKFSWYFAAVLVTISASLAYAAGLFPNFPTVGVPAYCGSTNNGSCVSTVPAGPSALSGVELVPADTGIVGGVSPQTVTIPSALLGALNTKVNRFIGGDFATNAWQRGTTPLSSATPTTATMAADRWAVYSSGNTVTVSKQTGAADSIGSLGLFASMRVDRPSGTDVTPICVGQVLDKQAAQMLIGTNGVFSFYGLAGAGFSAAGSNLNATIAYYTAADSATPGTNTDAFMKGTIAGYAVATAAASSGTSATVTAGVAAIPISTTWTRYAIWASIPAATAAGTQVTGAGVTICYTPVGTGGATDWFEIEGAQFQGLPSTVSAALPNGVTSPTGFERRPVADEQNLEYYYSYGLVEKTNVLYNAPTLCSATANAWISIVFPTAMRTSPTVTVTAGGYSIETAVAVTAIGTTTLKAASPQHAVLTSGAACTSTLPYQLIGTNTTGLLMFSAEP